MANGSSLTYIKINWKNKFLTHTECTDSPFSSAWFELIKNWKISSNRNHHNIMVTVKTPIQNLKNLLNFFTTHIFKHAHHRSDNYATNPFKSILLSAHNTASSTPTALEHGTNHSRHSDLRPNLRPHLSNEPEAIHSNENNSFHLGAHSRAAISARRWRRTCRAYKLRATFAIWLTPRRNARLNLGDFGGFPKRGLGIGAISFRIPDVWDVRATPVSGRFGSAVMSGGSVSWTFWKNWRWKVLVV